MSDPDNEQDPTRRIDLPHGDTGDHGSGNTPISEGVAYPDPANRPGHDPYAPYDQDPRDPADDDMAADEVEAEPRHGRDLAFGLVGAIVGILLTFIVIALSTADDDAALAAEDRDAAQQAELAERDDQLAERDERIADLEAQISDLEAQIASADLETDERDEELAAQREALDEQREALEARAEELDARQSSLDDREAELDEREAAIDDAATNGGSDAGSDNGDDRPGLDGLPEIPDEIEDAAQGIIDRILEGIRDLFG